MQEEIIKPIIAGFTKQSVEQINNNTLINRSAVNSSIQLHRMYAKLAEAQIVVPNYWELNTYGELIQRLSGSTISVQPIFTPAQNTVALSAVDAEQNTVALGIDIEEIESMPVTNDYRTNEFYTMNFAVSEISYCILQPNPNQSFAGLFAAKEAIVKADNKYKNNSFNHIIIEHNAEGKPVFPGFSISITHTKKTAAAVAIKDIITAGNSNLPVIQNANNSSAVLIALVALLIAAIAFFHSFFH